MNLPLHIARRYLFAKKSTNVINIITGIAIFGISVGAAALVLVLSVFNGFEDLITQMYRNFNPDVKISLEKGKFFEANDTLVARIEAVPGVEFVSRTMEEVAVFGYKKKQTIGTIMGVDDNYNKALKIDSVIRKGKFSLYYDYTRGGVDKRRQLTVLGNGIHNKLGINIDDEFASINVYMAKRKRVGAFENPFTLQFVYPSGIFMAQQEFDNQYIFASLEFVQDLIGIGDKVSALQVKLAPNFNIPATSMAIKEIMGEGFEVKNRYQQQEAFLKLMQVEKWLSFAIVSLMMLLISFNMIGALWMVVLEKKKDIAILKSMGCTDKLVYNIFLTQGILLTIVGIFIGFVLALTIYYLQTTIGIISVPGEFIIDAYPMSIRFVDFVVVAGIVGFIGSLASIIPALRAKKVPALMREE